MDDQRVSSMVRVKAAGTSGSVSTFPSPGGRRGWVFTPKLHGVPDGNALPSPDTRPGGLLGAAGSLTGCLRPSPQKCIRFNPDATVWAAKQRILCSLSQSLKDVLNYGLFQPACRGRDGKFLDEERLLREYPQPTGRGVPSLEVPDAGRGGPAPRLAVRLVEKSPQTETLGCGPEVAPALGVKRRLSRRFRQVHGQHLFPDSGCSTGFVGEKSGRELTTGPPHPRHVSQDLCVPFWGCRSGLPSASRPASLPLGPGVCSGSWPRDDRGEL